MLIAHASQYLLGTVEPWNARLGVIPESEFRALLSRARQLLSSPTPLTEASNSTRAHLEPVCARSVPERTRSTVKHGWDARRWRGVTPVLSAASASIPGSLRCNELGDASSIPLEGQCPEIVPELCPFSPRALPALTGHLDAAKGSTARLTDALGAALCRPASFATPSDRSAADVIA